MIRLRRPDIKPEFEAFSPRGPDSARLPRVVARTLSPLPFKFPAPLQPYPFRICHWSLFDLQPPAGIVKPPTLERFVRPVPRPHSRTISTPVGRLDAAPDATSAQRRRRPPTTLTLTPSTLTQPRNSTGQAPDRIRPDQDSPRPSTLRPTRPASGLRKFYRGQAADQSVMRCEPRRCRSRRRWYRYQLVVRQL